MRLVPTLACAWLLAANVVAAQRPPVTALAFAPGGATVLAASQLGVRELSWPELRARRTLEVEMPNLHCLAFAPDGKHLAVGGGEPAESGSVAVFSWPQGKLVTTLTGHSDSVRSVVWTDNDTLVSASIDRLIMQWDMTAPTRPRQVLQGHSRSVDALCLLSDRETLVSAGADQSLRVWQLASGTLVRSLSQHTKPVHALALRPLTEGLPMVASASADRSIRFWQPTIGRMVRYIRLESEPLDIAWLSDGQRIVAACADGHVRVIDANQVKLLADLPAIEGWAYALATHRDGKQIVVGGVDGQLRRVAVASQQASRAP